MPVRANSEETSKRYKVKNKRAALEGGPGYLTIRSGKSEHLYFKVQFLARQRMIAIKDHGFI